MKLINKRKRASLRDIEEREEAEVVEVKRRRRKCSTRNEKDGKDRISDLPDFILLHILEFMNLIQAVQTCVLSKRWKNLWKRIANVTLDLNVYEHFKRIDMYDIFVSRLLSRRDGYVPILNLSFSRCGSIRKTLMNRVIRYAASHNVRELTIDVRVALKEKIELPPSIFSCRPLTYLEISIESHVLQVPGWYDLKVGVKVPLTFELPALQTLVLQCLDFSTSNGYAEPFSKCNKLNTLVLNKFFLDGDDAKVLYITNPNLSKLTIGRTDRFSYEVVLATPKLSSFSTYGACVYELSSSSKLPFLNEVYIDVASFSDLVKKASGLISWLHVLSNVKALTLTASTIKILNNVVHQGFIGSPPPCFDRWQILKVMRSKFSNLTDVEVSNVAKYLCQNSPQATVEFITC